MKYVTVTEYITENPSIKEIKEKECQVYENWRILIEPVSDKLIMYIDVLKSLNS